MNIGDKEDTRLQGRRITKSSTGSGPLIENSPVGEKGKSGLKPDCLAYIKEVWTDYASASLRKRWRKMPASVRIRDRFESILQKGHRVYILTHRCS
jgi:MbtH protein